MLGLREEGRALTVFLQGPWGGVEHEAGRVYLGQLSNCRDQCDPSIFPSSSAYGTSRQLGPKNLYTQEYVVGLAGCDANESPKREGLRLGSLVTHGPGSGNNEKRLLLWPNLGWH